MTPTDQPAAQVDREKLRAEVFKIINGIYWSTENLPSTKPDVITDAIIQYLGASYEMA